MSEMHELLMAHLVDRTITKLLVRWFDPLQSFLLQQSPNKLPFRRNCQISQAALTRHLRYWSQGYV